MTWRHLPHQFMGIITPNRSILLQLLPAAGEEQVGVEDDAGDGGDGELDLGRERRGRDEALDGRGDGEEGDAADDEQGRLAAAQAQVVEARAVAGEEQRRAE